MVNITYREQDQLFHLTNGRISYVLQVQRGYLLHRYWGRAVRRLNENRPLYRYDAGFSPNPAPEDRTFSLDTLPREYPAMDNGDFREPAVCVENPDGNRVTRLTYLSYSIYDGKEPLEGLPATYVETPADAKTLVVVLQDSYTGLKAELSYTIWEKYDAICRSVRFYNGGERPLTVRRCSSASVDFADSDFDLLTLWGAHINERNMERRPLSHGISEIGSTRGASSHQFSPFIALLRPNVTEESGEVFAMSLVYSGSFAASAYVDQFQSTRLQIGLNTRDFSWRLEPKESFQTPECVMAYSAAGLDGMSQVYHKLYAEHLVRGEYKHKERPILINNWEATYFNFTEEKLLEIAACAKKLGIELFVLDDGWFGRRWDDNDSLGDWVENLQKLPHGLKGLSQRVVDMGLRFGLWFEPEMVSVNSNLYREHPDWIVKVPGRHPSFGRNQLVLDLSREDVCDFIIEAVSRVLEDSNISYIKWDMNRHITEAGSALLPPERQGEVKHRYMLGLYHVMEVLTTRFPHVLFESCSGGGGRFDAGMLYYMPQTWTSDDTDAIARLKIQYGTSLVFPPVTMGSHVSAVPNHQLGRVTPLSTRGACAMSGNLGYELDITKMSDEELERVRTQVSIYKSIRPIVQFGEFHRLKSPFESDEAAWEFISPDGSAVVAMSFQILNHPAQCPATLYFTHLDPNADYRDEATGNIWGSDELMNAGIPLPRASSDFSSQMWVFTRV